MAPWIAARAARSSSINIKQMAEITYMYDMQVIAEAKEFADRLIHRKPREEAEYDLSFADEFFTIYH